MRVTDLWRYPVKSMGGEQLDVATIGPLGIDGDRQWGLFDRESGLVLTARREPRLLYASARVVDHDVVVMVPDGSETTNSEELSRWLGRDVELRRATTDRHGTYEIALSVEHEDTAEWVRWDGPDGSFHDSGRTMVSLVSETTLGSWHRRRFRINVLFDGAGEDAWVDRSVAIGSVALTVVGHINRCVIVTRPQPDGIERDLDVLRTIIAEREAHLGISALVGTPGTVAVGDEVTSH